MAPMAELVGPWALKLVSTLAQQVAVCTKGEQSLRTFHSMQILAFRFLTLFVRCRFSVALCVSPDLLSGPPKCPEPL
jgi:hypothetical protein